MDPSAVRLSIQESRRNRFHARKSCRWHSTGLHDWKQISECTFLVRYIFHKTLQNTGLITGQLHEEYPSLEDSQPSIVCHGIRQSVAWLVSTACLTDMIRLYLSARFFFSKIRGTRVCLIWALTTTCTFEICDESIFPPGPHSFQVGSGNSGVPCSRPHGLLPLGTRAELPKPSFITPSVEARKTVMAWQKSQGDYMKQSPPNQNTWQKRWIAKFPIPSPQPGGPNFIMFLTSN